MHVLAPWSSNSVIFSMPTAPLLFFPNLQIHSNGPDFISLSLCKPRFKKPKTETYVLCFSLFSRSLTHSHAPLPLPLSLRPPLSLSPYSSLWTESPSMADHIGEAEPSLMEKIAEKIHGHNLSSSDSEDEHLSSVIDSMKSSVYRLFGREKPVHKVLGGGKTADIFLWRDKKCSGGVLGGATIIWVLFELLEYHLVTLVCHASILALAVLFLWSNASTFINKSPPHIPDVVLPEDCIIEVASALRIETNRGLAVIREIASGRELKKFLAVVAGLWFLSILGSCFNFITLFYIAVILLFTVPFFYEKYEDQVDAFAEKAMVEVKKHYAVFEEKVLSKIPKGPLKEKKVD